MDQLSCDMTWSPHQPGPSSIFKQSPAFFFSPQRGPLNENRLNIMFHPESSNFPMFFFMARPMTSFQTSTRPIVSRTPCDLVTSKLSHWGFIGDFDAYIQTPESGGGWNQVSKLVLTSGYHMVQTIWNKLFLYPQRDWFSHIIIDCFVGSLWRVAHELTLLCVQLLLGRPWDRPFLIPQWHAATPYHQNNPYTVFN